MLLFLMFIRMCMCVIPDYSYDFNLSESDAPPTTYLPEGFTYLPSQVCPEKLPSMSKYTVKIIAFCYTLILYSTLIKYKTGKMSVSPLVVTFDYFEHLFLWFSGLAKCFLECISLCLSTYLFQ